MSDLISYLKSLQRRGIKSVYRADTYADPPLQTTSPSKKEDPVAVDRTDENVASQLAEVASRVASCKLCALHTGRTKTVFGTGDPATKVMFIGEGPGRDEDLQGKPFVGRSGQLLTKIIEAIDFKREDVYITNIVKCRPPNNRDPQEDEVRCCEQYLKEQIKLIKPRVICALGRVSAHWLLDTKDSLASLRKSENQYEGTRVLVTYHPAALLRNPNLKKDAWEDFKKLRSMLSA